MFRFDIHRNFREVEVRSDTGGGGDARCPQDVPDHADGEFVRRAAIGFQVRRGVDEHLVNRIDMDVFGGDVLQIHPVHLCTDRHIMGHPGFCGDEIDLLQMPVAAFGVDHLQALLDLEEARPAGDAEGFQGGGDRQADGFVGAGLVGYHQPRRERIQSARDALGRSVKRLQVDGDIGSGIHTEMQEWRWADSNRRPNTAPESFLHAYSSFGCRDRAAGRRAIRILSF